MKKWMNNYGIKSNGQATQKLFGNPRTTSRMQQKKLRNIIRKQVRQQREERIKHKWIS